MNTGPVSDPPSAPASSASWWLRLRRWLLPLLGLGVLGLLVSHLHKVDWSGAWHALQRYAPSTLVGVLAIALASHALYGCFDLLGRRHTRHRLDALHTWLIAVTSYAFNLNLGSLVGGIAMRARLYTRAGLDEATVAQIIGLSLATNWLGYGVLGGGLFASGAVTLPSDAPIGPVGLRVVGVLLLLLVVAYVAACRIARGRNWQLRGRRVTLPPARMAMVQLLVSSANWALMGSAMYLLLGAKVPYATTLAVLLAAAIAGVVTPIPAGLGVLEAVYLALLSTQVGQGRLLGAVLAYRALYYLVPLMIGLALYALLERRKGKASSPVAARDAIDASALRL